MDLCSATSSVRNFGCFLFTGRQETLYVGRADGIISRTSVASARYKQTLTVGCDSSQTFPLNLSAVRLELCASYTRRFSPPEHQARDPCFRLSAEKCNGTWTRQPEGSFLILQSQNSTSTPKIVTTCRHHVYVVLLSNATAFRTLAQFSKQDTGYSVESAFQSWNKKFINFPFLWFVVVFVNCR